MKLTREEIECVFDHLREYAYDMFQLTADDTAPPLTTNGARAVLDQIQRLALSTLSQEAVRDEVLNEGFAQGKEAAAKICEARAATWYAPASTILRTLADAIRALEREPNAAGGNDGQ